MKFDREKFGYFIENPSAWENGFEQAISDQMNAALHEMDRLSAPVPMRLNCPACGDLHLDVGEFATKVHHTHACQACGMVWRPAVVPTVGVQFLPGFQNEPNPVTAGDQS